MSRKTTKKDTGWVKPIRCLFSDFFGNFSKARNVCILRLQKMSDKLGDTHRSGNFENI